jgi:hypothetical protein
MKQLNGIWIPEPPAPPAPAKPAQTLPTLTTPGIVLDFDRSLQQADSIRRPNSRLGIIGDLAKPNKLDPKRLVHQNIEDCHVWHTNYPTYLEMCWGAHLTPVLTPDIVWFTLLHELTGLVSENAEKVRHLFTRTKEGKEEIVVQSLGSVILPLQFVIDALKDRVPSGVDAYIPEFSTTTPGAKLAHYAAFCDIVSPYYNYSMMLCGFPAMIVKGTDEDWTEVLRAWTELPDELRSIDAKWWTRVSLLLAQMAQAFESKDAKFWRGIFEAKRCGSGGQTDIHGWWLQLYRKDTKNTFASNYPTSAARVNYKDLDTGKTYTMLQGLLGSKLVGNVLEPDWHTVAIETTP